MSAPKFKHDCDGCIFLGRFSEFHTFCTREHDLYVHWDDTQKTVIARYGNEGAEYVSGFSLMGFVQELKTAFAVAIERGLIPEIVSYPVPLREAFNDDLEAIKELQDKLNNAFKVSLGEPWTEALRHALGAILVRTWRDFEMEGKAYGTIPEFLITFDVGSSAANFSWVDQTLSFQTRKG